MKNFATDCNNAWVADGERQLSSACVDCLGNFPTSDKLTVAKYGSNCFFNANWTSLKNSLLRLLKVRNFRKFRKIFENYWKIWNSLQKFHWKLEIRLGKFSGFDKNRVWLLFNKELQNLRRSANWVSQILGVFQEIVPEISRKIPIFGHSRP